MPRATSLRSIAVLLLPCLLSCVSQDSGPPLMVRHDSAGIQIIEAAEPQWGDSSLWIIDPDPLVDLTLSGSGTPHEFFRVRSLMQRPDGSMVVADGGSQQVRLFSATGQFLGSIGGDGDAPGEFRNLWMVETVNDQILALDQRQGRVTVVQSDLALVRTFEVSAPTRGIHSLGDGTVLLESTLPTGESEPSKQVMRTPVALLRYDLRGARVDSLGQTRGREQVFRMLGGGPTIGAALFAKEAQVATWGSVVFSGSGDLMEVEERDLRGELVRILRIPDFPLSLTNDEILAERQAYLGDQLPAGITLPAPIRQFVDELPVPASRPAYAEMLADPTGAVWLELYRGRSEQNRPQAWLVLDATGSWLGIVDVPDRFAVMEVTMETVLGVWRDELDVEHPQVLTLTRKDTTR